MYVCIYTINYIIKPFVLLILSIDLLERYNIYD